MERVIVDPLKATPIRTLIVIDALDECKDEEPASAILSVLSRNVDQIPQMKFFITGCPEPRIRSGFRLESLQPITKVLRLHDIEHSSVDSDIRSFFRTHLSHIAKTQSDFSFVEDWPGQYNIDILCGMQLDFSFMLQQLSSLFHPPITHLMRGLISLFHFHKTLLMKEGWALISSTPKS